MAGREAVTDLVEKLFAIHDSLTAAGLAHAFGGAIALAYCVEEPRGTRDLDVNIFTPASNAETALGALPDGIEVGASEVEKVRRDGQTRLGWAGTPIDVFLSSIPLHDAVAAAVVWVRLAGREVPVLDCASLVIFKALFGRTQDWADIEKVVDRAPGAARQALETLADLVAEDDRAYKRLRGLLGEDLPA
jgi:hypothetical protein